MGLSVATPAFAGDTTGFVQRVVATADGFTDVQSKIQTALNAARLAGGGTVIIPAAANPYLIGSPLLIGANTTLSAYGATIQAKSGTSFYMVQAYGQASSARTANLRIFGGTWDVNGQSANRPTTGAWIDPSKWVGHGFDLQKLDGLLHLRDVTVTNAPKWCIAVADFTDLQADNLTFNTQSDGIHFVGPGNTVNIRDVRGTVGDDMVGMSLVEWPNYAVSEGNVNHVVVENLNLTYGLSHVRMLGGKSADGNTTYEFGSVAIRHVRGTWWGTGSGSVYFTDNQVDTTRNGGVCRNLLIEDVDVNCTGTPAIPAVQLGAQTIDVATLRNIRAKTELSAVRVRSSANTVMTIDRLTVDGAELTAANTTNGDRSVVSIDSSSVVNHADLRRLTLNIPSQTNGHLAYVSGATVGTLRVGGRVAETAGSGTGVKIAPSAVVSRLIADGIFCQQAFAAILIQTTAQCPKVALRDVIITTATYVMDVTSTTAIEVVVSSLIAEALTQFNAINAQTSASVTVYGGGVTVPSGYNVIKKQAGATRARVRGAYLPANLSEVDRFSGDACYNTSSSLTPVSGTAAGLVGPCVCDGTNWKNLFSGSTF